MGRHSLPDQYGAGGSDPRVRSRRRTVALAAALVLVVAGSAAAAVDSGLLSFGSSCHDDPVRLAVAASPDLAPALTAAAKRAEDTGLTSDGQCLAVTVRARESSEVTRTLAEGGTPDAHVWVADSDLWVQRISSDRKATRVTPLGSVASTPVGVAMVPAAAKSLGWPTKTYTWLELAGTALRDGALRLGAADPTHSASGLLALTQVGAATSGVEGGDTQAAALMKALSQRTSDTDAEVLRTLPRDASAAERGDREHNQAVVVTEQAAFAYNSSAEESADLDLFYPKDGSPRLDYPYALVDKTRLTTDESRAAIRFMTYLRRAEQQRLLERYGFRTSDYDAPRAVVATAGGSSPQPFAAPAARSVSETAVEETLGMWTITVQRARLTTVVDTSSSMAEPMPGTERSRMDVTKASLLQALTTFTSEDEIGLWQFSTALDGARDYRVLVPTARLGAGAGADGGGTQRDRLTAAFGDLAPVPNGATGLYDTTLAAYRAATSSYVKGKFNALVILTDGVNEDPGSISRTALLTGLRELTSAERPVPLIMIAVGPEADREEAELIARTTGGSAQSVSDPSQIHTVILQAIVAAGTPGGAD
ncbi:substrate-binding and VWA domain-containing protein [Streptomyces sp. NPDC002328]|uniref:substrate-binding and VWA domain-containing protein n=1 Tax=Streptomyces sp. NPDC002328 TaxID=3364642 RepID=UPI0036B87D49